MPILIGGQNSGKTTFFQYLTPPDSQDPGTYPWVATIQQGIGYLKERPHALHAGWMVLLDECERYFKRQYTEELKNLVSVPVDRSARKFENERSFPRSFVLCGTANNADFLVDPTGNRRFMPIIVAGKVPSPEDPRIKIIDLDRLKADRDSIWAAAYRAYLDKPEHLFSSYELACINTYLEGFTTDNPTDLRMARILETKTSGIYQGVNYVTMSDLFLWLEIPLDRQASMQLAVSDSLKRLGYELRRVSIAGQVRRIWTKKTE
jgi:predicted P-loop ATPase